MLLSGGDGILVASWAWSAKPDTHSLTLAEPGILIKASLVAGVAHNGERLSRYAVKQISNKKRLSG